MLSKIQTIVQKIASGFAEAFTNQGPTLRKKAIIYVYSLSKLLFKLK